MGGFKLMFGLVLFYLTFVGWFSNTWVSLWMLMEVSFMVFMGLFSIDSSYSVGEMSMKYFIVQAFAGLIVLISILLSFFVTGCCVDVWLGVGLFTKLGLAPFHFWVIGLLGKSSWAGVFFMLGLMKLLPLTFVFYSLDIVWMGVFLWGSIWVGSIFGIGNSSAQKLLGYSGMVGVCWMVYSAASGGTWCFFFFFFGYLFMLIVFCFYMSQVGIFYLNQFKLVFSDLFSKIVLFFFCLVFSGIPPFLGFLLKWWVSWFLVFSGFSSTVIFLIIMSLASLIFYVQFWFYFMLIYSFEFKWYLCVFNNNLWFYFYFFCVISIAALVFFY
uniref:NADH-ubiquinone oxidoreductase chain 2 n=1 Tax=Crenidorsum turpiniae TaxID=2774091 RepID=A0A7L7SCW8_9HEMI|nr:NADH dehydrogenase subunit 2 [Crenidorsum turpiniae]QNV48531.1 NADH dehydrogenase subunit 2 [Crenidorsum turpiniae]